MVASWVDIFNDDSRTQSTKPSWVDAFGRDGDTVPASDIPQLDSLAEQLPESEEPTFGEASKKRQERTEEVARRRREEEVRIASETRQQEAEAGFTGQSLPFQAASTFVESANDALASLGDTASFGQLTRLALGDAGAEDFRNQLDRRAQARASLNQIVAQNSILGETAGGIILDTASAAGGLVPTVAAASAGTPFVAGLAGPAAGLVTPSRIAYATIAAQTYPQQLNKARNNDFGEFGSHLYAAVQTFAEVGTEVAGGALAKGLGTKTLEQLLDSGPVAGFFNRLAGITLDGAGELVTEVAQNATDVFSGLDETALDFSEDGRTKLFSTFLIGGLLSGAGHAVDSFGKRLDKFAVSPTRENAEAADIPLDIFETQEELTGLADAIVNSQNVLAPKWAAEGKPVEPLRPPVQPTFEDTTQQTITPEQDQTITPEQDQTIAPEQTPEQTQERTPPSDQEPLPPGIALENASMGAAAKRLGRDEVIFSPARRKDREVAMAAVQAGMADPIQLKAVSNDILNKPRTMTTMESAGMSVRLNQIESLYFQAQKRLEQADAEGNTQQATLEAGALQELQREFDLYNEASHIAGTEWGFIGRQRQIVMSMDSSLSTITARMRTAAKKPLTEAQKQEAADLSKEGNELREQQEVAIEKQRKDIADEFFKDAKDPTVIEDDIPGLVDRIKQLLKDNCDLE